MSSAKPAASSSYSASLVQARSRQSTAAKLTVKTAEGDTVTLSFRQKTQARFEAGEADGSTGRASAARGAYRQQTEVEVSIAGNLSDAELDDIKNLIANPVEAAPKTTTLKSFDFAYTRRTEVDRLGSRFSLKARRCYPHIRSYATRRLGRANPSPYPTGRRSRARRTAPLPNRNSPPDRPTPPSKNLSRPPPRTPYRTRPTPPHHSPRPLGSAGSRRSPPPLS